MESVFRSWRYVCNAYHKPDIQYHYALAPKKKGQKKPAVVMKYQAICPRCGTVLIPDRKTRMFVNFLKNRLNNKEFAKGA